MDWNRNISDAQVLGDLGVEGYTQGSSRRGTAHLGASSAQRWNPPRLDYYERQWRTQQGAWGDPEAVESQLSQDVDIVVGAFREKGTQAGLREAKRRGLLEAARLYVKVRADTEEQLAARLAQTRARLAKKPRLLDKLREAFLQARLQAVREAAEAGHTPPQAVADRPEVPRKQVSRWVPYAALTLSVIAFLKR